MHQNNFGTRQSRSNQWRKNAILCAGLAGIAIASGWGYVAPVCGGPTTDTFTQDTLNSNGTGSNFWSIGANWSLTTPAGASSAAVIPASGSLLYNADLNGTSQTVNTLSVGAGSNIYNSGTAAESLTITPSSGTYTSTIAGNIGSTSGTLLGSSGASGGGGGLVTLIITGGTNSITGTLYDNLALTINGGTTTLSGANTYTGGTTINGGTLSISSDSNLGTGGITFGGGTLQTTAAISGSQSVTLNTSGGTIDTDGQSDTLSGNLTGAGGLTVESSLAGGVLILSGADTASGSILINSPATLEFSGNTTGFTGNITDNSALVFAQTAASSLSGVISGSGTLTQNGTATLTLFGANNYSGTTTISSGTLEFAGSTAGLTGNVTDDSALSFNQTASSSLSGIISGTGTLTEAGTAGTVLTLSGANTYSGTTTITSGTLEFTGSTAGLSGNVTDDSALSFNQTANSSLSGIISGTGTVAQNGTAALTLSGANTFTGGTSINSGTLIAANNAALGTGSVALVGGTLETPLVASAGVLGGNVTLNTGAYTQSAGTTLGLALSGTPASGSFDSIHVTGSAALAGTLDALVQAGAKPALGTQNKYNIITTTTGVSGNFSSLALATGSVTGVSLSGAISGNDYVLTLSTGFNLTGTGANLTANQTAVLNYLNTVGNTFTLSGGTLTLLQSIAALPAGQLGAALNQIAPNAYISIPNMLINASIFNSQALNGQISGQFEGGGFNDSGLTLLKTTNTDPFSLALASALQSNSKVNAQTSSTQYLDDVMQPTQGDVPLPSRETAHDSFGGFIAGEAILGSQPTSTSGQNYFTGGIDSGVDYRFAKSLLVGISFNYSYTNAHVDGVGSVLTDNSYSPGVFAGYRKDNFYADVSADYNYTQFSIHRNLNIGGSVSTATGKPDTNQADVNTLLGYNFPVCSHFKAGPAIGLDYTHVNVSSYTETGSPGDLAVSRYSIDSLRSLLGGQAEYKLVIPKMPMPLTISANAFWQHEYLNNSHGITAALAGAGSGSFITNVSNPGRDSALIGAGVSGKVCRYATLFANYEAQIGPKDQHSQSVMVGMAVSF